jgi:hypothetical protein
MDMPRCGRLYSASKADFTSEFVGALLILEEIVLLGETTA